MTLIQRMREQALQDMAAHRRAWGDSYNGPIPKPSKTVAARRGKVSAMKAKGMTVAEIAVAMSMNESTVKSDLMYARASQ